MKTIKMWKVTQTYRFRSQTNPQEGKLKEIPEKAHHSNNSNNKKENSLEAAGNGTVHIGEKQSEWPRIAPLKLQRPEEVEQPCFWC